MQLGSGVVYEIGEGAKERGEIVSGEGERESDGLMRCVAMCRWVIHHSLSPYFFLCFSLADSRTRPY